MTPLDEEIGPNDSPTTEPERLQAFHERFQQKIRNLTAGDSHLNSVLMLSNDELAFDAAGDVITALERDQLSAGMRALLADYISQLDVDECRRLLSAPKPSGRPNKRRESFLAVSAYVFASRLPKATEESSLAAAYEAYDTSWKYDRDSKRFRSVGRKTEPISEAQYRIDRWIKPILRGAGCEVSPTPRGRKPKHHRKPSPSISLPR